MQDGIIKGNGDSRYLKSVGNILSLYPTYESFAAALAGGTFPVDLNGINSEGWTQTGTPLSKATLLTDETEKAIWGNAANRTPNDALKVLGGVTPLKRGGTGKTTAADSLYALVNGSSAMTDEGLDESDCLGVGDVSAATGKKVTVGGLGSFIFQNLAGTGAVAETVIGTTNSATISFSKLPRFLLVCRNYATTNRYGDLNNNMVAFADLQNGNKIGFILGRYDTYTSDGQLVTGHTYRFLGNIKFGISDTSVTLGNYNAAVINNSNMSGTWGSVNKDSDYIAIL